MKQWLIHYSEIALKGKNRPLFERQLIQNLRLAFKQKGAKVSVQRLPGRLVLHSPAQDQIVKEILLATFGIAWFAPVLPTTLDKSKLKKTLTQLARSSSFTTFAIRVKKAIPLPVTSQSLETQLGEFVRKTFFKKVNLTNPELTFFVEIVNPDNVFLYTQKHQGPGGLPVGSSGRCLSLLSGGIDSPVASVLMMKRGVKNDFIHFHSYPKTDRTSIEKAIRLVTLLKKYQPQPTKIWLVPILPIQQEMLLKCQHRFLVLLYRRVMLKIAEKIANQEKIPALVTGDNLGQVASQTIENLWVQQASIKLPVFRPLLTYDKQEIVNLAQNIGTFPISTLPQQDCCSLFIPKHPITKAKLAEVEKEEAKLKLEVMINRAIQKGEIKKL